MKFVPPAITRAAGKAVLNAKKNSPHFFFSAGVVGVIGSTVLACRATLKVEPVVDEIQHKLYEVRATKVVSESERRQLMARTYGEGAVQLGKLYGPSLALGAVSIAALTGSHIQLTRRNTALAAAYAGVQQLFDQYRERVRAEVGEEKERDIYLNAQEVEGVDENGKKTKIKAPTGLPNQHARYFDKNVGNWKNDPDYNRWFLQGQQEYANQKLHVRGHMFLNDIYDALGFERTSIGSVVGWVIGGDGDGYISFGLDDWLNVSSRDVLNWSCLLDFNVDPGLIWDKI